jgi:ankyrin repeat protein
MVSCESKDGDLPVQLAIRNYQPPATIKLPLPDDISTWNSTKIRRKGLLHEVVDLVHLPHPPRQGTLGLPFTSPKQEINQESHALRTLDLLLTIDGINVNVMDEIGSTLLLTIASNHYMESGKGSVPILRKLLQNGADVNAQNNSGFTASQSLAVNGIDNGLMEVLRSKPRLDIQDSNGNTPFHVAIISAYPLPYSPLSTLRRLMEHEAHATGSGCNSIGLQSRYQGGLLPIHLAVMRGQDNIIQLFHETDYISDINVSGPRRRTPLHLAVLRSDPPNTRTVLLLLELGADVNCSDESKQTPLHMATLSGQMDMVKLLLQHGANPLPRNFKGHQPWVCAALVHNKDLIVFLKELTDAELGKAVNSKDFLGKVVTSDHENDPILNLVDGNAQDTRVSPPSPQ